MSHTATAGPSKTTATPSKTTASADKIRCKCGDLAKRLTSQSEKNPGRVFYQCYRGRDDVTNCKFFLWEDMVPGKEGSTTESPGKAAADAAVARYNATLAAKASPIPKAGNYSKAFGGTTSGYTYGNGTSPLKPISSIPHPPPPLQRLGSGSSGPLDIPATPDEVSEVPASQIPDLTIGAGWNSARKRAMAKIRRQVMKRALEGRTSDGSSTDEDEEEIVGDAGRSDAEVEVIEAYEPMKRSEKRADVKERSDDFDSDGIAWVQVDVDAIEASASQQAAQTPRIPRAADPTVVGSASRDHPPRAGLSSRATFMDRLKAVDYAASLSDDGPTPKKRKRGDGEDDTMLKDPQSASTITDGATTPSFVSACGTLTPPETERRSDLAGFSSMTETGIQSAAPSAGIISLTIAGNATIHPLLEALNKDLLKRDRRAAADEKSREMLRGRVKALEGRVRDLEAELRKVKSERRA